MQSESIGELAKALVKFQGSIKAVKKDTMNPYFKNKYADLASIIEAIREPLSKNGLAFSQFPSGESHLTTILMHESGQYISESFYISPKDALPQSLGSAITYGRRYALSSILGLATEDDDDGNMASGAQSATKPQGKMYLGKPYPTKTYSSVKSAPILDKDIDINAPPF